MLLQLWTLFTSMVTYPLILGLTWLVCFLKFDELDPGWAEGGWWHDKMDGWFWGWMITMVVHVYTYVCAFAVLAFNKSF